MQTYKILMVCNSVIGNGETSGSSIRARKYNQIFKEMGYTVQTIQPYIKRRIHPLANFPINLVMSGFYISVKTDILYSISDLFPDAVFGIFYKLIRPKTYFICGCHSLVQPHIKGRTKMHSLYAFWSQQVILFFLKYFVNKLIVSNEYDQEILKRKGFKKVVVAHAAPNF